MHFYIQAIFYWGCRFCVFINLTVDGDLWVGLDTSAQTFCSNYMACPWDDLWIQHSSYCRFPFDRWENLDWRINAQWLPIIEFVFIWIVVRLSPFFRGIASIEIVALMWYGGKCSKSGIIRPVLSDRYWELKCQGRQDVMSITWSYARVTAPDDRQ